jgi:hypothetical protein
MPEPVITRVGSETQRGLAMAENARNARNRKNKAQKKDVKPGREDQATAVEFEREGMGVAPKE